jgi:hypothetical protein
LPRSRRSPGDWRTGVSPHHTMACGDVGGRVTDCEGSSVAVEWPDPEGGDGAPIPVRRLRLNLRNWVAVATANGQACAEWATRGDERRNTVAHGAMTFRWVRLERPLCSAWTRRVRFPGVRALGGSSARRLGGLTGRQLTGPVAEAPEVNLRRSARSDHETELAARSPGGADANSSFFVKQSSRKKSYYEKTGPRPGVWFSGHFSGRWRARAKGFSQRYGVGGFCCAIQHHCQGTPGRPFQSAISFSKTALANSPSLAQYLMKLGLAFFPWSSYETEGNRADTITKAQ